MTPEATAEAYESLVAFLYQAPIGLLQTTSDGEVAMLNPMAAQLLLPLAPGGALHDLFAVLDPLALGCDKGQGYWFARPLEEDALRAWLVARRDQARPAA